MDPMDRCLSPCLMKNNIGPRIRSNIDPVQRKGLDTRNLLQGQFHLAHLLVKEVQSTMLGRNVRRVPIEP